MPSPRGTCSTPAIKRRAPKLRPFLNLHITRQKARLHRLHRNGLAPDLTKAQARALCDHAARNHPIRRV